MSDTIELRRTPLYDFHAKQGAKFVPFGEWEMPVQYTGIQQEHLAVREAAGLFDVSHMGEAWVQGPEAELFLNHVMTNDLSEMEVGQCIYTMMCYHEGGVVDDLIINKMAPEQYLICLNASNVAKDMAWLLEHADRFECGVHDMSSEYAQLALQGPKAASILESLAKGQELPERFRGNNITLFGCDIVVTRTGYTGEDGFELYLNPEDGQKVATGLLEAGKDFGLKMAGLGARDSLRLEAGFPLYGHEISQDITPIQAKLGWVVKGDKAHFIGKRVLQIQREEKKVSQVLFFTLDGKRIAREGAEVYAGEEKVGVVLSGSLSPVLNQAIGSALIERDSVASDLEIDFRGKRVPMAIKKPPLHVA